MLEDGLVEPPDVVGHGGVDVVRVILVASSRCPVADYSRQDTVHGEGPSAVPLGVGVRMGFGMVRLTLQAAFPSPPAHSMLCWRLFMTSLHFSKLTIGTWSTR